MEETEHRFDVQAFTADVADALGDGWTAADGVQAGGYDAFLRRPDGAKIHVTVEKWPQAARGRVFLTGSMPRSYRGPWDRYRISVSQTKTGTQAASDVRRRLLPGYLPAIAAAVTEQQEDEAYEAARLALAERLAGILGGRQLGHSPHTLTVRSDDAYADVKVRHGSVRFTVDVDADRAAGFAEAVKPLLSRGPKRSR